MNIIGPLLAFGLLTTILYALYSALLRWLHTPVRVTAKPASVNIARGTIALCAP